MATSASILLRERAAQLKQGLVGQDSSFATPISKSQALVADLSTLEADLKRREVSYERREQDYQQQIEDLDAAIDEEKFYDERLRSDIGLNVSRNLFSSLPLNSDAETSAKFSSLRSKYEEIVANLDSVKSSTSAILTDQESDLLRAFRARLYDVQIELDREKSRKVRASPNA